MDPIVVGNFLLNFADRTAFPQQHVNFLVGTTGVKSSAQCCEREQPERGGGIKASFTRKAPSPCFFPERNLI